MDTLSYRNLLILRDSIKQFSEYTSIGKSNNHFEVEIGNHLMLIFIALIASFLISKLLIEKCRIFNRYKCNFITKSEIEKIDKQYREKIEELSNKIKKLESKTN